MPRASSLQDPCWTNAAELCIGCGYSLHGLAAPGRCPECGAAFDTGQLVLTGIVRRSRPTSLGRRAAWAGVITSACVLTMFWPMLLMLHAVVLVAILVLTGGGLIALWVTSPRERTGVERIVITRAGIARTALHPSPGQNRLDAVFTPWDGANSVKFTRVSPVWRRLVIRVANPGAGVAHTVFDAGFRCSDAAAPDTERAVRDLCRAALSAGPQVNRALTPRREEAKPH